MFVFARSSPLWPALCALIISAGFVFFASGPIQKDASEYDRLARSIVAGQGFSLDGQHPSMVREPGYPLMRAGIYGLGGGTRSILWAQALLAALTIYLVGRSFQDMHPVYGKYAAWASLLSYSFFSFSGRHLAEILVGFLCSALLCCWIRTRTDKRLRWAIPFLAAALCITRFTFLYLSLLSVMMCFWGESKQTYAKRFKELTAAVLLFIGCIFPWMWRNHTLFGTWAFTNRAGIQVYARAWKAGRPLPELVGTYASVLFGRVAAVKAGFTPIIDQQWLATSQRFNLAIEHIGYAGADQELKRDGMRYIVSSYRTFLVFLGWSPLEMLRLFALTSPRAWDFSIESMFYPSLQAGSYTVLHGMVAFAAQLLQLFWWAGLLATLFVGFRRERLSWIPGWLILMTALTYLPFDAIVRYAIPLYPWIMGAMWYLVRGSYPRPRADISSSHTL
jgi:hypothetical protein